MTGRLRLWTWLVATFGWLAVAVAGWAQDFAHPRAHDGVMDLSGWNFSKNGAVQLDGAWEFQRDAFLPPLSPVLPGARFVEQPRIWNRMTAEFPDAGPNGFATYRLYLRLPPGPRDYALHVPFAYSAYSLFLDGLRRVDAGVPGTNAASTVPHFEVHEVHFQSTGAPIELMLHVANFSDAKGGLWNTPTVGLSPLMVADHNKKVATDFFVVGSLFLMALYLFGLFLLRPSDRASLCFGGFCLLAAARSLFVGDLYINLLLPNLPWNVGCRIEYLVMITGPAVFFLFVRQLFPADFHRWLPRIALAISGVFAVIICATAKSFYGRLLPLMDDYIVLSIAIVIGALGRALIKRRTGSANAFIGLVFLIAAAVNDILYSKELVRTGNFTAYGVFLFVLAQALNLAMLFTRAFQRVATLTDSLLHTNRAYERFVPKQFLRLLNRPSIIDVRLGDQVQRTMTVLFSDIRDFTRLSERMTPEENFNFLNDYLGRMSPVIARHHGFIDKYIGDGIMALFPEGPDDAVEAALDMQAEVARFSEARAAVGLSPIRIGIGVHCGELMLGTVGDHDRMDGTVISDAVNLSARLEQLTKPLGVGIVISEDVRKALKRPEGFVFRPLEATPVKGKTQPVAIHEVVARAPESGKSPDPKPAA